MSYSVTLAASASTVKGGEWVGLQATCSPALSSGDTLQILIQGNSTPAATLSSGSTLTTKVTQTPSNATTFTYVAQAVSSGATAGTSNTVSIIFGPDADGTANGYQNQFGGTVTLVNMPTASVPPGSTLTLTAQATGFNSPTYQFWWLPPNGSFQQDPNGFIGSNTFTTPSLVTEGTWVFACYALESGNPDSYPYLAKSNTFSVSVESTESVTLSAPQTAAIKQNVTLTATASNISQPTYQFWMRNPQTGNWSSSGSTFQSSNRFTFQPQQPGGWQTIVYAQPSGAGFA